VDDFLSNFTSSSTIRGYRCHLKQFFILIERDPDTYIVDVRRLENDERLNILESYEKDIKKYWQWLISEERSPKTIVNAVDCIRVFLKQYRIRLDDVVWENFRRRGTGNKPISRETPITKEMLKKILIHGDAKSKAMFLVISSSGMRIGETANLKMKDVDFDSVPTKIIVRYTGPNTVKTKTSRPTFISNEATDALKEWLKIRDESLALSIKRTNFPGSKKQADDDRVFCCCATNIRDNWNRLIEKAGLNEKDERTARHMVIVHGLRKYFKKKFGRYNSDVAEVLMGHEGYLLKSYLPFTDEELKQEYLKGMNHLLVFETAVDAEELKTIQSQLEETKKQLIESNKRIDLIHNGLLKSQEFKNEIEIIIANKLEKLQRRNNAIEVTLSR
jgi:integrase